MELQEAFTPVDIPCACPRCHYSFPITVYSGDDPMLSPNQYRVNGVCMVQCEACLEETAILVQCPSCKVRHTAMVGQGHRTARDALRGPSGALQVMCPGCRKKRKERKKVQWRQVPLTPPTIKL